MEPILQLTIQQILLALALLFSSGTGQEMKFEVWNGHTLESAGVLQATEDGNVAIRLPTVNVEFLVKRQGDQLSLMGVSIPEEKVDLSPEALARGFILNVSGSEIQVQGSASVPGLIYFHETNVDPSGKLVRLEPAGN